MAKQIRNVASCSFHSFDTDRSLEPVLKHKETYTSIKETTCPIQGQSQTLEAAASTHKNSFKSFKENQAKRSNTTEPETPPEATSEVMKCWDEDINPAECGRVFGDGNKTKDGTNNELSKQCEPYRWHFPAGPGLSKDNQWPMWHVPVPSYYPRSKPLQVVCRVWEELEDNLAECKPDRIPYPLEKFSVEFTVMSYNILAQDLLHCNTNLYVHCPPQVLEWKFRCKLLLEEIQQWKPDILCLQEVQENHYNDQLHPFFSQMGYTCVYKRRTGNKTDGCAICYLNTRFREVKVTMVEFFRPETELLDRHNVGIVLLLQPVITCRPKVKKNVPTLCVANTHLLYNPKRGDIKLVQLAIMLAEISLVVNFYEEKGEHCNVIFCGDFNSAPFTPLYELITFGELFYNGLPRWMISGQEDFSYNPYPKRIFAPLWCSSLGISDNCTYTGEKNMFEGLQNKSGKFKYSHEFMLELRFCPAACICPKGLEIIPGVTDNKPDYTSRKKKLYKKSYSQEVGPLISHNLSLQSVYKHAITSSGFPEVTTMHFEDAANVDYIFYSPRPNNVSKTTGDFTHLSAGLKLKGFLSLLSEDVLQSMNGLPNHKFPSDHLSLLAHFQLDFIV